MFERLDGLWEKYPQFHVRKSLPSLEDLLQEHESWKEKFTPELQSEYEAGQYQQFLIPLSWDDLPYRMETRKQIEQAPPIPENSYVSSFMEQFSHIDIRRKAAFLFPESNSSQFFVMMQVCRRAETFCQVRSLFPDEDRREYLAVFDKGDKEDVILLYHLAYGSPTDQMPGGYLLYEYPLGWYQSHLRDEKTVFRSPFLPDRIARYLGNLPFYFDPARTVYVRRQIAHILDCGYMSSELEFFLNLTTVIMPFFQRWYKDLEKFDMEDGQQYDWRLEREKIRTVLTADGTIPARWKQELSLFQIVHDLYPDTLFQHHPQWLGRQSLDVYIPSLKTAIEYQGIQHYDPVSFFGGEDGLLSRQELDRKKKVLCEENGVRLIEWPYSLKPTVANVCRMLPESASDPETGNTVQKEKD